MPWRLVCIAERRIRPKVPRLHVENGRARATLRGYCGRSPHSTEGLTVKERGVDRRSHRRFEIVGTFLGSLETWHPLRVRNLGAGGALVETAEAFPRDWRVRARVTVGGRRREMRVDVRHAAASPGGGGYVVGLEFPEPLSDMNIADDRSASQEAVDANERRRYPRIEAPRGFEIEFARWTTVELADVSMSGAMLIGPAPIDVGGRAHFRARLGDRSFYAEVEARRIAARTGPNPRYGIGALFVSMGADSRQSLASFLMSAEN